MLIMLILSGVTGGMTLYYVAVEAWVSAIIYASIFFTNVGIGLIILKRL